ncbi:Rv3654c family TadE-like protein [Leifsonia sp. NPDC014704]|uniref:Rv3654c family TadE-like protein n=1 Tax=Leifsonia sp. NPDC014704 TaxID=3364123 RepID=UPI0036F4A390
MRRRVPESPCCRSTLVAALASHDRGSGSVLALAAVCAVVTVASSGIAVVGAGAAHARAAMAADLAALAGADVASGRAGGVPCDVAQGVAQLNGAALTGCEQNGVVVTVTASAPYLAFAATASARAGPPGGS